MLGRPQGCAALLVVLAVVAPGGAGEARRPSVRGPDLSGDWQVELTAIYSSCRDVGYQQRRTFRMRGERGSGSWQLEAEAGREPRDRRSFRGPNARRQRAIVLEAGDGAKLRLQRKGLRNLTGVLLEPRPRPLGGGCAVVYRVEATPDSAATTASNAKPPTVGVPSCDRYFAGLWRCMDKMAPHSRDAMKDGLDQVAEVWRDMSASSRTTLDRTCSQAIEMARKAYGSLGCQF